MLGTQSQRVVNMVLPVVLLALSVATLGTATAIPRAHLKHSSRAGDAEDIQTVTERRFATIVGATTGAASIPTW